MASARVRLGDLLVDAQIITRQQLDEVLAVQKRDGRRIGTLLVEASLVSETQVTQILSQQLSVPWVSLYHVEFSRQLLNLVGQDLAERYCLVPIFVRRVRGQGKTLYVAMDDPSDEAAQRELQEFSGLPVRAMIAPPSDIRSAIRAYYGAGGDAASLAEAMAEADAARALVTSSQGQAIDENTAPMPVDENAVPGASPVPDDDSGPQIEAHEIAMPVPRSGSARRMVTLTLLDGTQVNLPARNQPGPRKQRLPSDPPTKEEGSQAASEGLTARDLVAALRAVSHGADASEILGEHVRWEALFSALLSVMLKKHLIADWEFVEEYKKV